MTQVKITFTRKIILFISNCLKQRPKLFYRRRESEDLHPFANKNSVLFQVKLRSKPCLSNSLSNILVCCALATQRSIFASGGGSVISTLA